MAKAKKAIPKKLQIKITANRNHTKKIARHLSDTFLVNRLVGESYFLPAGGPDPFDFVVTILINRVITIKGINVNGVIAKAGDIKIKGGNIECNLKAYVSTYTFLLIIDAEGDNLSTTTFNLTCDGKKVFSSDQDIAISTTGRGGYSNPKVPLP